MATRSFLGRFSSAERSELSDNAGDFEVVVTQPEYTHGNVVGISLDTATVPNARPNVPTDTPVAYAFVDWMSTIVPVPQIDINMQVGVETAPFSNVFTPVPVVASLYVGGGTDTYTDVVINCWQEVNTAIFAALGLSYPPTLSVDDYENCTIEFNLDAAAAGRRLYLPPNDPVFAGLLHFELGTNIRFSTLTPPYSPVIGIPKGQYTATTLAAELTTQWSLTTTPVVVTQVGALDPRFVFTYPDLILYGPAPRYRSARYLGITEPVIATAGVITAQAVGDLAGDVLLYICSNLADPRRAVGSQNQLVSILGSIEMGEYLTYATKQYEGASQVAYLNYPSDNTFRTISFQIRDVHGEIVDLGVMTTQFLVRFWTVG
jgi:hypothetical protein